jgi:hypothetical protein
MDRRLLRLIFLPPRRARKSSHAALEADDLKRSDVDAGGQLEDDVCPARWAYDVDAERGLAVRSPLGAHPEGSSAALAASRRMMHARHGKPDALLMARYYTRRLGSFLSGIILR